MGELVRTVRLAGLRPMLRLLRGRRGMQETMIGHYVTRMLQALLNVGFLDEMRTSGQVSAERFALMHGLDPKVLGPVCEALYALRVFTKDGDRYALDARGRVLAGIARGWFIASYGYEDILHSLEALLRKEKAYPRDISRHIESVTAGYAEMEKSIYFPWVYDIVRTNGFKRVLDLGCGDGTFLRCLCEAHRGVTGYGVDIAPAAIGAGKRMVDAAGLADRIHLFVADIARLDEAPEELRNIDVAVTFFVLHEVLSRGADHVVDLLVGFRERLPGVPLIVFEVDRPTAAEMRRRPGMGIVYFLQHDLTHQKPVAREDWHAVFRQAGFASIEEINLWFARTVIFTLR